MIYPCLVCHAPMAAKLCVQNGVELVGICHSGNSGCGSISGDGKLAILQGSNEEPGGEFEV